MKIVYILNCLRRFSGVAQMVSLLAREQRRLGNDVEIISFSSEEPNFIGELEAEGCTVTVLSSRLPAVYNPALILALRRRIAQSDIVHVHQFPGVYWTAMASRLVKGKARLIVTEHSAGNNRRKHRMLGIAEHHIYSAYQSVVCVSQDTADALKAFTHISKDPLIIPNGIDFRTYGKDTVQMSRESLGIPSEAKVVLQVARFEPPKQQETVIEALAKLPEHVFAVFIGKGERLTSVKKLAEELNVAERVRFVPFIADIPNALKIADVLVLATSFEGMPLTLIEGMHAGLPLVASDAPGVKETVGDSALLFPIADSAALAAHLNRLLTDDSFLAEMKARSHRRREHFSARKMLDAYNKLYGMRPGHYHDHPLVTIVMPCYNGEATIARAIQSIQNQTYTNWELIIVDDCSTDNTVAVAHRYASSDSRIKIFCTEHNTGNPATPRNMALERAAGEFIAFLDCDDEWLPEKLDLQIESLRKSGAPLSYSYFAKKNSGAQAKLRPVKVPLKTDYHTLLRTDNIPFLTAVVRRDFVGRHRFKSIGQEDYCFWLDLFRNGSEASGLPVITAIYNESDSNRSNNKLKMLRQHFRVLLREQHIGLFKSMLLMFPYAWHGLRKYMK